MRHIKYFLSIMAVLILLTGCSTKSETSGKEEKGDKETTVDAPAAAEQVQTEETQQAAQAPAEATEQPAESSGESKPAEEDTNKAASSNSNIAASTKETPSSNTAASVKQTQEGSSKPAASTQTAASQPSQGSAASQPSSAPAPASAPSQPASQPASEPKQEQKKETAMVTLSIRDNGTMILSKTTVELQEGDTVFAVLARTVKQRGIQMEYTGAGDGVYVEGINNLYEMDRGPKSGWRYYVNGALATRSAGAVKLSKGDRVEWRYTNDHEKDGQ